MESRGTLPAPAIGADDASELAALFEREGPFVTVYLNSRSDVERAAQQTLARWRNLRDDLDAQGAASRALDDIEAVAADAHRSGETLAAVADSSGLLLVGHGRDPIADDWGLVGALPAVVPLLAWRQASPNHAVVVADRVGADVALFLSDDLGGDAFLSIGDMPGDEPHLRKSKPGGWSQRRFQERAENNWEANMKQVAARLAKLDAMVDLRLVAVAGDIRACSLLEDHLPPAMAERLCRIEGSRAADGGLDVLVDEVATIVDTAVSSDTVAILQKFREELGQQDRAADGVPATLEALSAARVDTLLVADDLADMRQAWFSAQPPLAAVDVDDLRAQGVAEPTAARLADVAVRTAFSTGARVRVVPSASVTDGLGAILRF